MSTRRLLLSLALLTPLVLACGLLSAPLTSGTGSATQDVGQIVQATFQALTAQAVPKPSLTPQPAPPTATATLEPAVADGKIAGNLMYPASGIPALRIVAMQVGGSTYYYVDTALGQSSYEIDHVPPGTYHVVAYTLPGGGFNGGLAGGYSQMVPCGLQYACNDHTLIDVVVTAGSSIAGVDPNDYYADPGTFPLNPAP
jgi:hypothetical protein